MINHFALDIQHFMFDLVSEAASSFRSVLFYYPSCKFTKSDTHLRVYYLAQVRLGEDGDRIPGYSASLVLTVCHSWSYSPYEVGNSLEFAFRDSLKCLPSLESNAVFGD